MMPPTNPTDYIPAIAVTISILTFCYTVYNSRMKAGTDYVRGLEVRVKDTEDRLLQCEAARETLGKRLLEKTDENIELFKKLVAKV